MEREPKRRKASKHSDTENEKPNSRPGSVESGLMKEPVEEEEEFENIFGDEKKDDKETAKWKRVTIKILDSWGVSITMTIATVYALFFDDIRVLYIPKVADNAFYALTSIALVLFILEILFASLAKPGYWLSFFFVLDLISTISLITDIGWIMELILAGASGVLGLAKLSRAGRITRLVRVIRLIRLIRIVKLYK